MSVTIISNFTDSGVPKEGLTPTIRIRKVSDGSLVVTDEALTELGDGSYKYVFSSFDPTIEYSFRVDGTSTLSDSDRYQFGSNEAFNDDIRDEFINKKTITKDSDTQYTEKLYNDAGDTIIRETTISTDGTTETRTKV
tara:strand:- start:193 stop:606 length:414 start_codon:yes stop_codon:yes gene_type:complete